MAFVNESKRDLGSHMKGTASGMLGPGEYHNEGALHKMAMDAIYPKKQVPFNSNQSRGLTRDQFNSSPGKLSFLTVNILGPGAY